MALTHMIDIAQFTILSSVVHQKYRDHQQNIIPCVFFDRAVPSLPNEIQVCVLLPQDKITYALQDGCNRFR